MTDLEIGKHCGNEDCNRLDFLPIKCIKCHIFFCQYHCNISKHKCIVTDEENEPTQGTVRVFKCSVPSCVKKGATFSHTCDCCKLMFCTEHRHCGDHVCHTCNTEPKEKKVSQIETAVKNIVG